MNEILSILALFDWINSYKPDLFLITEKPLVIKWINPFDNKKNIRHLHPVYGEKTRIIADYYKDCFQENCNIEYYLKQYNAGGTVGYTFQTPNNSDYTQTYLIPYTKPKP